MEEHNPYRAPESAVALQTADTDLAGYGERLAAALIDGVIAMCVTLPAMWFGGFFKTVMDAAMTGAQPPFTLTLTWAFIGLAIFLAIQGYPLHAQGQTWGKRALGIRIVALDGSRVPFASLIARRYLPIHAVALVPFVGNLLVLIDILFIFRRDRRCVHDLIAGTRVVKAR